MSGIDDILGMATDAGRLARMAEEKRREIPSFPLPAVLCATPEVGDVWEKKKILFVLLLLASPMTLAGARLRPGMRRRIAARLSMAPSVVSRESRKVAFYHAHYPDFKADVGRYYEAILGKMGKVLKKN